MATATRAATRMNCKKSETVAVTLKKGTSTISSWVDSRAHLHVGVVGVDDSASELMKLDRSFSTYTGAVASWACPLESDLLVLALLAVAVSGRI